MKRKTQNLHVRQRFFVLICSRTSQRALNHALLPPPPRTPILSPPQQTRFDIPSPPHSTNHIPQTDRGHFFFFLFFSVVGVGAQ